MNRVKLPYLLGSLFIVAAFVAILGATLVSPGFVEANLSPDNDLAGSTIQTINTLRTVAGLVSLALVFAGLTTLAYARYERLRSSMNSLFTSVILPLIRPIRRLPFWSLPLVLAMLILPLKGVTTSPDTASYLQHALHLYQGEGYTTIDKTPVLFRGPILSGLIALSFSLIGTSVGSALFVIRISFLCTVMLSYAIGERLGGKWAGLIAALLVLSSAVINTRIESYILPDSIMATFILTYVYGFMKGMDTEKIRWFLISGVALALAYLTKELALVFLPMPALVLLIIPSPQTKSHRNGVLALYSIFIVTILPWVIYTYAHAGSFIYVLGHAGMKFIDDFSALDTAPPGSNLFSFLGHFVQSLNTYYKVSFAELFILSPLLLISWFFLFLRVGIYRLRSEITLATTPILFIPVMLFVGELGLGWPSRHSAILYILTYVTFAYGLVIGISTILRRITSDRVKTARAKRLFNLVLTAATLILVTVQVVGERDMLRLWTGNSAGGSLQVAHGMSYYSPVNFTVLGWHNSNVRNAANWLDENSTSSTTIMSDWFRLDSLYFFMNGEKTVNGFTYINSSESHQTSNGHNNSNRPLFLWSKGTQPGATIYALTEASLIRQLREAQADYVVTTFRRGFLSIYFTQHPGYERVAEFGDGKIQIYRVLSIQPIAEFQPHITTGAVELMNRWSQHDSKSYRKLVDEFMVSRLGLGKDLFPLSQSKDNYQSVQRFTVYR